MEGERVSENIDVLAIIDRLNAVVQSHYLAAGEDMTGSGLIDDGERARAAIAELIAADNWYDDAQFGVARARYNGQSLDVWVKHCAEADIRRAIALCRVKP